MLGQLQGARGERDDSACGHGERQRSACRRDGGGLFLGGAAHLVVVPFGGEIAARSESLDADLLRLEAAVEYGYRFMGGASESAGERGAVGALPKSGWRPVGVDEVVEEACYAVRR